MKKIVLLLFVSFALTNLVPKASVSYEAIAQQMLKNFAAEKVTAKAQTSKKKKPSLDFKIPELNDFETHQALLKVFSEHEQAHDEKYSQFDVLNNTSAVDLNLYFYDEAHPEYTLTNTLYRGKSLMGRVALAHRLATPITNTQELEKRQKLITWFMQNPKKAASIQTALKEFAQHEKLLLSLWNPNDLLYSKQVKDTFFGGNFKKWQTKGGGTKLELKRRLSDLKVLLPFVVPLLASMGMHWYMQSQTGHAALSGMYGTMNLGYDTPDDHAGFGTKTKAFLKNWGRNPLTWIQLITSLITSYPQIRKTIAEMNTRKKLGIHIRKRLQSLAHLSKLAVKIHTLIQDEPELVANLSCFAQLDQFVQPDQNNPQQQFLKNMKSGAFKGNSYFFANIGKVFHSIPQFLALRNSFAPVMNAIGIVDAQVGLSKLYTAHKDTPVTFSFAQYKPTTTPHLDLQDFWHPMINPQKVVPNSVALGAPQTNKNIVITGPNASGKSTVLKAITLCVLLAQTIGIVPARAAAISPFAKITTYLNIVDNLGQDQSLFKAEVARAQELLNTVNHLEDNKLAFTVMDEIFSATAPREGEAAAFGIGYALAQAPNAMTVIATHFPRLTTLPRETKGSFKNYKVFVEYNKDGTFTHPFLLQPGRAHQVIALDLMKQDGFESKILDYANQFLKDHPTQGVN